MNQTTYNRRDVYTRQDTLNVYVPETVVVVGCGGVGSWVAYFLARIGVPRIYLIDPDVVELSNLNRCPFEPVHVGEHKATCMAEIIQSFRPDCDAIPFAAYVENIDNEIIDVMATAPEVFDCRDVRTPLPKKLRERCKVTGGYDGLRGSIDAVSGGIEGVYAEQDGKFSETAPPIYYRTVPSYVIPAVVIAAIVVNYVCVEKQRNPHRQYLNTIPMDFSQMLATQAYAMDKKIEESRRKATCAV